MGVIRFLLAFAVVVSHDISLYGLTFTDSIIAVQAFYVISGFYMALILNEKYASKSYTLFISNRLLRLLPIYWVIVAIMLVSSLAWHYGAAQGGWLFFNKYASVNYPISYFSWVFVIFADIFILFQDMFLFLGFSDSGGMEFVSNFRQAPRPLAAFLIIPQAWTVGLEILFYLLVPFIIRFKNAYIIGIALLTLLLRFAFYSKGLNYDPWTYRFFPFELLFFLMGILSFRLYLFVSGKQYNAMLNTGLFALIIIYIACYQFIPLDYQFKKVVFFALFTLSLPFVFAKFRKSKIDAWIGEFSYPVYLSHVMIGILVGILDTKMLHAQKQNLDLLIIASTLVFSYLLIKFVSRPIETIRQRRVKQIAGTTKMKQNE